MSDREARNGWTPGATEGGGRKRGLAHLPAVDPARLLGREPFAEDVRVLASYLAGARVMVTGAGGSIGRELSRQISARRPDDLVLLGRGENSIYELEQELLQTGAVKPKTVIADVRDRASMEAVMARHRPEVVIHAAAHKHVPLMERHPIEAFRNNVLGTLNTAELAVVYGASRFVLISTDKAVKPSCLMGATKRIGELIVGSLANLADCRFAVARFGNVIGSRGSLVPSLEAQIRRGGPILITNPDMTRYFMTIPEAVQLILHAGALGEHGEVYIFEMGDPVRIADVADMLIDLHGLRKGIDIEIEYVGIRPGEKLHEELVYEREALEPTNHPRIRVVRNEAAFEWSDLMERIRCIRTRCNAHDAVGVGRAIMELSWTGVSEAVDAVAA